MTISRRRSKSPRRLDRRRGLAAALILLAMGAGGDALVAAQEPAGPDPYRRASDALVGVLFPEARRHWPEGDLVWPDGRRQKLSLTGVTWAPREGGWWLVAGAEFPDAFDEQVHLLRSLKRPTERQAVKVVVAKADAEWRILEHRTFEPDPESPLSKLVSLGLVEFPDPAVADGWPRLQVRGVSGAFLGGGAGLVWWDGTFDVASMSWWMRSPSELWRKESDGKEARDLVDAAGTAPATVDRRAGRAAAPSPLPAHRPATSGPTPRWRRRRRDRSSRRPGHPGPDETGAARGQGHALRPLRPLRFRSATDTTDLVDVAVVDRDREQVPVGPALEVHHGAEVPAEEQALALRDLELGQVVRHAVPQPRVRDRDARRLPVSSNRNRCPPSRNGRAPPMIRSFRYFEPRPLPVTNWMAPGATSYFQAISGRL